MNNTNSGSVHKSYTVLKDGAVLCEPCYLGRCHECLDEDPDDQDRGSGVLLGYVCEHGRGRGHTTERGQEEDQVQDGILLTRLQLREWACLGRDLTDGELEQLKDYIPQSSIPEAIASIAVESLGLTGDDDDG